jgi:hypothetical protein
MAVMECGPDTEVPASLRAAEAGDDHGVPWQGRIVAPRKSSHGRSAADVVRDVWPFAEENDLIAPDDRPAGPVASWD